MENYKKNIGVLVPDILLPKEGSDFSKWAVVACDQFTSQPEYWEAARNYIGDHPSTLDIILPEAFLGKPEEAEMIADIRKKMEKYLADGTLESKGTGFVLVERQAEGKTRNGLILALDLDCYDFHKGSDTLIRATEATIESRIPPRLRIREGACVESPHILVLIDDPNETVIEPLTKCKENFRCLYDTELMQSGGHIAGYLVSEEKDIDAVCSALEKLTDADAFHAKYGDNFAPLLFAMGDGNHSFATAKANWEKIKATLPEEARNNHPARFALVEIENVHDKGIVFEPIHRVVFGVEPKKFLSELSDVLNRQNGKADLCSADAVSADANTHVIPYYTANEAGTIVVSKPSQQLTVGTLQNAIDAVLVAGTGEVDYIHGADVVKQLSMRNDAVGFLLPTMKKEELFPTVVYDGALPRKTFSMGEANEKRYYMECRKISD